MNHMTEGGEYGKLNAIAALLFDSKVPLENIIGLYLAKDFSDREDVIKTEEPRYDGDHTRRGSARYMLSAYFARQNKTNAAKLYLKKALEDNNGRAAYALYYLNETEKLSPPLTAKEAEALMNEGIQKQKKYYYWENQGYSCWLQSQIDGNAKDIQFTTDVGLVEQLLQKHGSCKQE